MKKTWRFLGAFTIAAAMITSCSKDDTPTPEENDNEVITTVEVHLTDQSTGATEVFSIDYPDGYGVGITPVKETIMLDAGKTYSASLLLLDKTKTSVDTTSIEIEEENDEHRFYIEPSAGSNITVNGLNTDDNGITLGSESTWIAGAAATGTVTITLRHYVEGGKAESDPVNSTKSTTDIEVVFDTEID